MASKNAIAFIAGLGTGFLSQQERDKDRARQDKKDQQDDEIHAARMDDVKEKKAERTALKDAGATVTGTGGFQVDGPNGKEFYLSQAEADAAQSRYTADAQAFGDDPAALGKPVGAAPVAATGITGRATGNVIAPAGTDVAAMNTPQARAGRTAAALYGVGKPVEAMQIEQGARAAQAADRTEADAMANNLTMKAIREHNGDVFKAMASIGTKGKGGLDGVNVEARPTEDGKTMQIIAIKDGKETVFKQYSNDDAGKKMALQDMAAVDPVTRIKWFHDDFTEQLAANKDKRETKLTDAHATYYGKAGDALATKADAAADKVGIEKMNEIDKVALGGINTQVNTINTAITKAMAEGTWDEKSPGAIALKGQLATLNLKRTAIASKYEAGGASDPLGMNKKPAAAGGITTPGDKKQGQLDILQQEMTKATAALAKPGITPEERTRAEGDIASLTKELATLGKKGGTAAPAKAAASAGLPATPKPAAAVPAANTYVSSTAGDRQFEDVAKKAGYKAALGQDGELYFSRVVDGQGENLTAPQLAKRLNVIY